MSPPEQSALVDTAWKDVLRWLPANLDQMAKEEFGFRRRGSFQSAADVLRLAMAYSVLDLSLRLSAAWLTTLRGPTPAFAYTNAAAQFCA